VPRALEGHPPGAADPRPLLRLSPGNDHPMDGDAFPAERAAPQPRSASVTGGCRTAAALSSVWVSAEFGIDSVRVGVGCPRLWLGTVGRHRSPDLETPVETWGEGTHMIRKLLLVAAAVALPLGIIVTASGTASAKGGVTDETGAPATASCNLSGGTLVFKYAIGISGSGYVPPTKNKGNQITISGVTLTCTSSAVSQGSFTGVASGKIKTTDPSETPGTFYSCTSLEGVSPSAGGTLSGTLKIKWSAPAGVKFSEKKSAVAVTSIEGGTNNSGQGTFTIPGNPGTGSISGGFPGTDGGASSSSTDATQDTEAQLATQCEASSGLSTIALATGTASEQ